MATATATAKPKAEPKAPMTLDSFPPYQAAVANVDRCRAHKEAAEEALAAARRVANKGADNRAARVHALATGAELPPITPDDHTVLRAEEERETATEALILAGERLEQTRSEFAALCLAEVREEQIEALRDQEEALAALEAAVRRQTEIRQSIRARGASPSSPSWYQAISVRQIADARKAIADCIRQLSSKEL